MASTYPTSVDTWLNTKPVAATPMNDSSVAHATLHQNVNDAVKAVQTVLGTSPAGAYSSVAARLAAASYQGHTHAIVDVTGLQAALDGKAAASHTHTIANVTGLQAALDGKAASSHTHSIAQVTGLQTALDGKAALSSTAPAALGTAAVGTATTAARADHVHALPTLTTLGAAASARTITAGSGLTGGGDLSANRTLSANLTTSGGNNGTATTVARGDHNHDGVYAKVITQTLGSALPSAASYPAGTIVAQY